MTVSMESVGVVGGVGVGVGVGVGESEYGE